VIVLASVATLAALGWSFVVLWANAMRSSPGKFQGAGLIAAAWIGTVIMWLAWWFS